MLAPLGFVGSAKNPSEQPDEEEMKLVEKLITQEDLEGRKLYGTVEMMEDYTRAGELRQAGHKEEAKRIIDKYERLDKVQAKRHAMKYLDVADLEELLQLKKAGKTEYEAASSSKPDEEETEMGRRLRLFQESRPESTEKEEAS